MSPFTGSPRLNARNFQSNIGNFATEALWEIFSLALFPETLKIHMFDKHNLMSSNSHSVNGTEKHLHFCQRLAKDCQNARQGATEVSFAKDNRKPCGLCVSCHFSEFNLFENRPLFTSIYCLQRYLKLKSVHVT